MGRQMKIVMIYNVSDDCTYTCEVVLPIIADSIEAAFCAYDDARKASHNNCFSIFGVEFDRHCGEPTFLPYEDWFKGAYIVEPLMSSSNDDELRVQLAAANTKIEQLEMEAKKPTLGFIRYTAESDVAKLREKLAEAKAEIKSLESVIDIFVANEEKCDAILKSVGLDDTLNIVPRLSALAKDFKYSKAIDEMRVAEDCVEADITKAYRAETEKRQFAMKKDKDSNEN